MLNDFTIRADWAIWKSVPRYKTGPTNMIKVDNLVKTFGHKRAVDGVSFSVERGEVLGFLGTNGAGKSTSMRMITGFIPTTEVTIQAPALNMIDNLILTRPLIA